MKLRNKKTGEVIILIDHTFVNYNSIAEFNADWEVYKPVEPLIKDEKIRNVIKLWSEVNSTPEVQYDKDKDCIYSPYGSDGLDTTVSISFDTYGTFENLVHRQLYTIDELCGRKNENS